MAADAKAAASLNQDLPTEKGEDGNGVKRVYDEASSPCDTVGSSKLSKKTKSASEDAGWSSSRPGSQHELDMILVQSMQEAIQANSRLATASDQKCELAVALKTAEFEKAESDRKYKLLSKRVGVLKGEVGQARIRVVDLEGLLLAEEQQVKVLEVKLREKDELVETLEGKLHERDEAVQSKDEEVQVLEAKLQEKDKLVETLEAKLHRCKKHVERLAKLRGAGGAGN